MQVSMNLPAFCQSTRFSNIECQIEGLTTEKEPQLKHSRIDLNTLVIHSSNWTNTLETCPETFQYAPWDVRSDKMLATKAVHGNPAMIQFVGERCFTEIDLKELAKTAPRIVLFLNETKAHQIIQSWPEHLQQRTVKDPRTFMSQLDMEHLDYLIQTCQLAWQNFLEGSQEDSFLYLKRKSINSPHTIQVFKDGTTWIHPHHAYIGSGTKKKAKLIYDWQTKEELVKLTKLKNRTYFTDQSEHEIFFHEQLKNCRGICQLRRSFTIPTKDPTFDHGRKTVLVQKRYDCNLPYHDDYVVPPQILARWDESDLQRLTLDLLWGLKACQDRNIYDRDYNFGNVLLELDHNGHIISAVNTDFDQAIVLNAETRQAFEDPFIPDYETLTYIIQQLGDIYNAKGITVPEVLKEGFYKPTYSSVGFNLFATEQKKLIQALDPNSSDYLTRLRTIRNSYFETQHLPTKTLNELLEILDPQYTENLLLSQKSLPAKE